MDNHPQDSISKSGGRIVFETRVRLTPDDTDNSSDIHLWDPTSVLEAARDAGEIEVRFEPYDNFFNWVVIHHRGGVADPELSTTSEVSPFLVTQALLKVQVEPTVPGDVNLDYAVNLTDPLQILEHLFGGGKLACRDAADFNEDAAGRHERSDRDPQRAVRRWSDPAGAARALRRS